MRDFSHKLVPLLEDNIRVMIYAGKQGALIHSHTTAAAAATNMIAVLGLGHFKPNAVSCKRHIRPLPRGC